MNRRFTIHLKILKIGILNRFSILWIVNRDGPRLHTEHYLPRIWCYLEGFLNYMWLRPSVRPSSSVNNVATEQERGSHPPHRRPERRQDIAYSFARQRGVPLWRASQVGGDHHSRRSHPREGPDVHSWLFGQVHVVLFNGRLEIGMHSVSIVYKEPPTSLSGKLEQRLVFWQGLLILYIRQRIAQMGPKKTEVLFSRKLTLYTVNLAPPGGKFKFLILFCLLKPPGALDQKSCLMQSKAESNSA